MKTKLLGLLFLAGTAVFAQPRVAVGVGVGGYGGYGYVAPVAPAPVYGYVAPGYVRPYPVAPRYWGRPYPGAWVGPRYYGGGRYYRGYGRR
jgi:hypothetical protein